MEKDIYQEFSILHSKQVNEIGLASKHMLLFFLLKDVYNYRPDPESIGQIDSALADCYRALGPRRKKISSETR